MRIRVGLCCVGAAALAVTAVLAFGTVGVGASTGSDAAEQLLDGTRQAVTSHDFDGVMVVEWSDRGGRIQRTTVPVTNDDGRLRIQGLQTHMGAGPSEIVMGDQHALVMWTQAEDAAVPSASKKYRLTVQDGPAVAGRTTTLVEARAAGAQRTSARFFVDRETGILLRSQQFGADGRLVRSVSFMQISEPVAAPAPKATAPPSSSYAARATRTVAKPFRAPARAGTGYALVGRYQMPNGTVQLFYSDGLFDVSLFQQKGHLDWGGLPAGGTDAKVAGRTARRYVIPGGVALVWDARGVVYTCVTDAPSADLAAFVSAFPTDSGSGWGDAVDVVLAPFSW
ncbi:MAG: sigma regulatory protein MucB/RseB [Actinomycetia bacterium]|nr:sigma regulatory protein MucB/RseB [Actinomycetes bacterium]